MRKSLSIQHERNTSLHRVAALTAPVAALIAAMVGGTQPAAAAGTFGGFGENLVRGFEVVAEPGNHVVFSDPSLLDSRRLCQGDAGKLARGRIEQEIGQLAQKVNAKAPKGVSIVRLRVQHSPNCTAKAVMLPNNTIALTAALPRNVLFFSVTTPDIAFGIGVSRHADPRFSVDFDVNASAQVSIPGSLTGALTVGPVKASIANIKPDSQNLTADIAKFVANTFFPQFQRMIPSNVDVFKMDQIRFDLGRVTKAIKDVKNADHFQVNYDPTRKLVQIRVYTVVSAGPVIGAYRCRRLSGNARATCLKRYAGTATAPACPSWKIGTYPNCYCPRGLTGDKCDQIFVH